MILLQTPRLTLQESYAASTGWKDFKHKKWIFCPDTTHEFFDFPEDVRYIKFVAHSHPGQGRVKVELDLDSRDDFEIGGRTYVFYEILADGEGVAFHTQAQAVVERLLKKHKKIYVECLYED